MLHAYHRLYWTFNRSIYNFCVASNLPLMLDNLTYISIFWRIYLCESLYIHWLYTKYQNNQMKNIWSLTINQLREKLIIMYWSDVYNYFCMQYRISDQHVKLYIHKKWFHEKFDVTSSWIFINTTKINCLDYIFLKLCF